MIKKLKLDPRYVVFQDASYFYIIVGKWKVHAEFFKLEARIKLLGSHFIHEIYNILYPSALCGDIYII